MSAQGSSAGETDDGYTTPTSSPRGGAATMPRRTNATRLEMLKDLMLILFEDEDNAIFNMLRSNNVKSIHQLCSRDNDAMQALKDADGNAIDFQLYMDLVALRRFLKYSQLHGQTINQQFIVHLGIEEYEHFIISGWNSSDIDNMRQLPGRNDGDAASTSSTTHTSTTRPRKAEPVRDFERGIKRDVTLFPHLKDDAKWDHFRRDFMAQIDAQGLADVVDESYEPETDDEKKLYALQSKFVYAAFVRILQTDSTKTIVRKHELTKNAKQIYLDLVAYFTTSTKAELDTAALLEYITTSNIADGWNGSAKGYVLHWMEQIRLYRTIKPDAYDDEQLRIMLQNAINPNPDLRAIGAQEDYARATGARTPSFEQYYALVKAAAERYDASHNGKRKPRARRNVYAHTLADVQELNSSDPDAYGVDTFFYTVMQARSHFPRLTREQWQALESADQVAWDKLTDAGKRTIIGNPDGLPPGPPRGPSRRPPMRRVNLTDLTPAEHAYFQAQLHDLRGGSNTSADSADPDAADAGVFDFDNDPTPAEVTTDDREVDHGHEPDQLYAHMTRKREAAKANKRQPGDVIRLLSKPSTKKP